jgi:thiol-disulfide isomerase/thioredoxin
MKVIKIEKTKNTTDGEIDKEINDLNIDIDKGKYIIVFFFLEGCTPCKDMKIIWKKITDELKNNQDDDVVLAEIDQVYFDRINDHGKECDGFPCIRIIHKGLTNIISYDDEREPRKIIAWINKHTKHNTSSIGGGRISKKSKNIKFRKTRRQKGGNKKSSCKKTYCEKEYIPKMMKMDEEVQKYMNTVPKKTLTTAQRNMLTVFKRKSHKNKSKKIYSKVCEQHFCNEGCKGTMFQDGKTLPQTFEKKYKGNKALLQSFKEQRTFLFKGKTSVLNDNFFKQLSKKDVNELKEKGAISGCAQRV